MKGFLICSCCELEIDGDPFIVMCGTVPFIMDFECAADLVKAGMQGSADEDIRYLGGTE